MTEARMALLWDAHDEDSAVATGSVAVVGWLLKDFCGDDTNYDIVFLRYVPT